MSTSKSLCVSSPSSPPPPTPAGKGHLRQGQRQRMSTRKALPKLSRLIRNALILQFLPPPTHFPSRHVRQSMARGHWYQRNCQPVKRDLISPRIDSRPKPTCSCKYETLSARRISTREQHSICILSSVVPLPSLPPSPPLPPWTQVALVAARPETTPHTKYLLS